MEFDPVTPNAISLGIETSFIGRNIVYISETSSTNDVANELARLGAPEGTVVITDNQTHGRGRLGRNWLAPKGKCILMSVILMPDIRQELANLLTMIATSSIVNAIRDLTRISAMVKWPNDVVTDDRKLSGVLCEIKAKGDLLKYAVIGIGINVNVSADLMPDEIANSATSIMLELGHEFPRAKLVQELLKNLEERYLSLTEGYIDKLVNEWRSLSCTIGRNVKVDLTNGTIEGKALDIDSSGALIICTSDGVIKRVITGSITHLPNV